MPVEGPAPVSASTRAKAKNHATTRSRPDTPSPLSQVSFPDCNLEGTGVGSDQNTPQDSRVVEQEAGLTKDKTPEARFSGGHRAQTTFSDHKAAHEERTIKRLLNADTREFYDTVCNKARVAVYPTDLRHCVVKWTHTVEEFELLSRDIHVIQKTGTQSITLMESCQPEFSMTNAERDAYCRQLASGLHGSISTHHIHRRIPEQDAALEASAPPALDNDRHNPIIKEEPLSCSEGLDGSYACVEGFRVVDAISMPAPEDDPHPASSYRQLSDDHKPVPITDMVLSIASAVLGGLLLSLVPLKLGLAGWLGFLVARRVFQGVVQGVSLIVGRSTRALVHTSQVALRVAISWLSYLHNCPLEALGLLRLVCHGVEGCSFVGTSGKS
ncbi:hypothetical protein FA13DRAFT_1711832 [Coprinellus micaceus]|uniref:Uncharacterized protein n=1 Tax=Coprinellus micaceus TaxID=71717 RepID=A0A4Y7T3N6_COPMI|nr:hypothetical protein FA13DRAFT_1711832 [Coprinellus micaceus]